jgi:hypothetical protein
MAQPHFLLQFREEHFSLAIHEIPLHAMPPLMGGWPNQAATKIYQA